MYLILNNKIIFYDYIYCKVKIKRQCQMCLESYILNKIIFVKRYSVIIIYTLNLFTFVLFIEEIEDQAKLIANFELTSSEETNLICLV